MHLIMDLFGILKIPYTILIPAAYKWKRQAKHFLAQHSQFDFSSPDVKPGLLVCGALQLRDKPPILNTSHCRNHIRFTVRISAGRPP